MSKSKAKQKSARKAKDAKKRDLSADEIKRAQKRLAKAISEMDAAQSKVQQRESELEAALKRHGVLPAAEVEGAVEESVVEVISELPDAPSEALDVAAVATSESDE